jgi:cytochrome P450
VTTACLDEVIETGEIDFVEDLTSPVPGIFTAAFLGIDVSEWERYAMPFHDVVAYAPMTPEFDAARQSSADVVRLLREVVADRRADPRDDFISRLCGATIDGVPVEEERVVEMAHVTLAGGVDTTTALTSNALYWLGRHPEERQRLADDPALIPLACEEFVRVFAPVPALARTVTTDVELGGQHLSPGERVLLMWSSANRDDTVFEQPDEVLIDRFPNRHAAFGLGAHRCIGSNFARFEFGIMLEQVLQRLPDYTLVDGARRYPAAGVTNGWATIPARFTPGPRRGSAFTL